MLVARALLCYSYDFPSSYFIETSLCVNKMSVSIKSFHLMTFLMQAIQSFNHHSITTMSLQLFIQFVCRYHVAMQSKLFCIQLCPSIVIFMDRKDEWRRKLLKEAKRSFWAEWSQWNSSSQLYFSFHLQIFPSSWLTLIPLCYFKYLKWQSTQIRSWNFLVPFLYVHSLLHNKWIAHCID